MKMLNLMVTYYLDHYHDVANNPENFKYITWSPFDHVIFKKANSLQELCCDFPLNNGQNSEVNDFQKDESEIQQEVSYDKTWNGIRQCMHLIEERFDKNTYSNVTWELCQNDLCVFKAGDKAYSFYCLYSVRFCEEVQKLEESSHRRVYNKYHIRKSFFDKIKSRCKGKDIDFRMFRSLGSEDAVVIFLSNSIKEIIKVIDDLNKMKFNFNEKPEKSYLFSTVCVFPGLNLCEYDKPIDMDLIVHLNFKKNEYDEITQELIQALGYSDFERDSLFLGIRGMKLHIKAGKISYKQFYDSKGVFCCKSDFYKKHINSSRIYFCIPTIRKKQSYDTHAYTISICNDNLKIPEYNYSYSNEKGNSSSPVAEFIFREYQRLIMGRRTVQWKEILCTQFMATKSFVEFYHKFNKFDECNLLEYIQSSLHLINQACSPAYEIPKHNRFYAGSFHDLLKAYYGMINMFFNLGYDLPHENADDQHTAVFAICLNAAARIESKIFTRTDTKTRFVVFFLPYDNFWNYSENISALAHEVFHYIAPYSRKKRAESLVKVIYAYLVRKKIKLFLKKHNDNLFINNFNGKELWADFIISNYERNVKHELLKNLDKKEHGFFIYSNPEWYKLFIYGLRIQNIIHTINETVNSDIINNYNNALKHIDENSSDSFCPSSDILGSSKTISEFLLSKDEEYIENNNVISWVKQYVQATKEAFCDLWAIKITGQTIPEYIIYLIKSALSIYQPEDFKSALRGEKDFETAIWIPSQMIRFSLLLHKYLSDEKPCSTINPDYIKKLFKNIYNSENADNNQIIECIEIIANCYSEVKNKVGDHIINSLCDMAFYGVDETVNKINKYDHLGCFNILNRISKTNLANCINMDEIDELSCFLGIENRLQSENKFMPSFKTFNYINNSKQYSFHVSNIGEYINAIDKISNIVSPKSQDLSSRHTLWYRGVCSDRFSLLPGIFRIKSNLSIYALQANVIKRAYFKTLYASDVWDLSIEQRMAALQHYGMPTNLLDFSLDPLVSLFFSITPDAPKDRIAVDNGEYQPVVYVFDPMVYSRAIRKMIEWDAKFIAPDSISSVSFDINHNKAEKNKFFVNDMSYDFLFEHNNKHTSAYSPNDRGDPFPVPIVIQQSNPRIIAQSGIFVAYSLNAHPQRNDINGKYDYLDLLTIQNRYFDFLSKFVNFQERFIFPIYLRKSFISSIRDSLRHLNVNTGKFYPELSSIFKETIAEGLYDGI